MVLTNQNIILKRRTGTTTRCNDSSDKNEIHDNLYNSKLYEYCRNHADNCILSSIINKLETNIETNIDSGSLGYAYILWEDYCALMKQNMFDIVEVIIINNYSDVSCDDFIAICLAAIDNNCIRIIDALLHINFDINCILISKTIDIQYYHWGSGKAIYINNPKYINNCYTMLSNAFGYAIEFGTLDMIKHLVQNGCVPKIIDDGVLKSCEDMDIFKYVLSMIEIDIGDHIDDHIINLLNCFFHNCKSKIRYSSSSKKYNKKIMKKVKIILDHCDANKFTNYINDQFGCCQIDIIKLLEHSGIMFDWPKLLHAACCHNNTELITYILDKNVMPTKETLEYVFNNVDKVTIVLFAKYRINLSIISGKNDHDELINQLEACGLDKNAIISYLMNDIKYNMYAYKEFHPNFDLDINSDIR